MVSGVIAPQGLRFEAGPGHLHLDGAELLRVSRLPLLVGLAADTESITKYMETHNPFFKGDYSDALSLIPFVILMLMLYLAGRERFLAPKGT